MDMKHPVEPALLAALAGPFHPVVLAEAVLPDGALRTHSGLGTLVWSERDWTGTGHFGGLVLPPDGLGPARQPGSARVAADPARSAEIMAGAESFRGAAVTVWFGAVTERAGTTLIGAPVQMWVGTLGGLDWTEILSGQSVRSEIEAELVGGPSQRSYGATFHSWQRQRQIDPTDTAGRWVGAAVARIEAEMRSW